MQSAIYKVPEGKLLKIFLNEKDGKIADIKITGDFFIHPEEAIVALEETLSGEVIDENLLVKRMERMVERCNIEFFGVDLKSIAQTIVRAAQTPKSLNNL